jgi:AmiR/NasT family two-component response regulator
MTAYWATDVHERADRAGITAILLKPCQPEHLIAELQRVLQRTRLPRLAQPGSASMTPARSRSAEAKSYF